jgi:hypothetical protein
VTTESMGRRDVRVLLGTVFDPVLMGTQWTDIYVRGLHSYSHGMAVHNLPRGRGPGDGGRHLAIGA